MKRIRLASIVFAVAALAAGAFASSASATPVFTLSTTIGSPGSGKGQFSAPSSIAIDSKGNFWVADRFNNRVQEFDANGQYLRQREISDPVDVAIDSKGNVWVLSHGSGQGVIYELNTEAEIIEVLSGTGKFWSAEQLAIDSSGNLWLYEWIPQRVQKYDAEGHYLSQFSITSLITGLSIDSSNNLWFTDASYLRIGKYNTSGTYLGQIGEGYLESPLGDSMLDAEGNRWVPNANGFVSAFNAKGEYINQIGGEPYNEYVGVVATQNGDILVLSQDEAHVERWSAAPTAKTEAATGVTTSEATLNGSVNPHGVETSYQFEYSNGGGWGKVGSPKSVGSGTEWVKGNAKVTGLEANMTYHFRIKATNAYGVTYGEDKTFVAGTNTWALEGSPGPAGAKGEPLGSVSCTSSEACVGVGNYTNSSGTVGTMAKVKSGSSWSLTSTPIPAEATWSQFGDVSCSSASACSAVGRYIKGGTYYPLVERWNGTEWTIQSTPSIPGATESYLTDIACTASNDCTATGNYTKEAKTYALAEHWNGSTWSTMTIPSVEGYSSTTLNALSCSSSSDCWAVGWATTIGKTSISLGEHWNGTTWSISSPLLPGHPIWDVSCASSSSCVALSEINSANPVVARWNGSSWSSEGLTLPENATALRLLGISCPSASACTAIGWFTPKAGGFPLMLTESWNGSSWSSSQSLAYPTGGQESALGAISCVSSTSCSAVGSYYNKEAGFRKTLVETRH